VGEARAAHDQHLAAELAAGPCEAAVWSTAGPRPCAGPAVQGVVVAAGGRGHGACMGHLQAIAAGYVDPDELTWIPARRACR